MVTSLVRQGITGRQARQCAKTLTQLHSLAVRQSATMTGPGAARNISGTNPVYGMKTVSADAAERCGGGSATTV
jgi:hypothetical protein